MSGVGKEGWGGSWRTPASMEEPRKSSDMSARLALLLKDLERKRRRTEPCEDQAASAITRVFDPGPGSSLASAPATPMLAGISADKALPEREQTEDCGGTGGQPFQEPRNRLARVLAGPLLRQDRGTGNSSFRGGQPHDRDALGTESMQGNTLLRSPWGPQPEHLLAGPFLTKGDSSSVLEEGTQAVAPGHAGGATDLRPMASGLASPNEGGTEDSGLSLEEFLDVLLAEAPVLSADELSWLDPGAPELPPAAGPDHSLPGASAACGSGDAPLLRGSHEAESALDALPGMKEERTRAGQVLQRGALSVLSGGRGLQAMPQPLPVAQAAEGAESISGGHKRKGPDIMGAWFRGNSTPLSRRIGRRDRGKALFLPGEEAQALEGLFSKRRAVDGTFSPARPPRSLRVSDKCVPAFAPLARRLDLAEMEKRILLWGEALVQRDMAKAKVLERRIRIASSPVGDYVQRLGALFLRAIKLRGTIAGATGACLERILKDTLKLSPVSTKAPKEAAQSLPEYFRLVPLARLCQSVGLRTLLDAADGQPYVHVVVLGNDSMSTHTVTVEALATLPQGAPRQLRFTVLDPCFALPQSMRALKEEAGKALGGKMHATVKSLSRLKFLYSYVQLTEVSVLGLHKLQCLQPLPQTSGTKETLVVISNLNLSHIPRNGNLQPNPRQDVLKWIRGMRPDILVCEEPLADLSRQDLQGSIRGCFDALAPLFALHDCYLRDLTSNQGAGLRPSAPTSRGADARKEAPGESLLVPRSTAVDVSKHVFLFEECVMATHASLSLASTRSQPLMHSLGLGPLKALLRTHGFAELPIPDALQALIPQMMRGCPREFTATLESGCIIFCCRGRPIAFTSLWTVGNDTVA